MVLGSGVAYAQEDPLPQEALREQPRRVGIIVSLRVNVDKKQARKLAGKLGDTLGKVLVVDMVAGSAVERRLPAEGLPESCMAESDCVADVAQRLDADELLFLVMVRVGKRVQIDTTWVDVESGRQAARDAMLITKGGRSARKVFRKAAQDLLPGAKLAPKPAVSADSNSDFESDSDSSSGRHMTSGTWLAAGITVVSLAGSVALGRGVRRDHQALVRDECATVICDQGRVQDVRTRGLYADVLLGAAIVASVAAVVLYARSGSSDQPAVQVSVWPGGGGVAFGGEF